MPYLLFRSEEFVVGLQMYKSIDKNSKTCTVKFIYIDAAKKYLMGQ